MSCNINVNSESETNIYKLFKSMNLSIGVHSDKPAMSWFEKHGDLLYYIDGCLVQKSKEEIIPNHDCHTICDIFNGKHLCDIYVSEARILHPNTVHSSYTGFKTWSTMTASSRSKILYNIAQTIEKYQQLFATVEAVSSGKHFSKVKAKDVPDLIESFNYYACCAAQVEKDWFPAGPVCVVAEEYNNPSLSISLRIGSILASGSSVLLLADIKSSLSSFLLAEICYESGLPPGVFNVIPFDQGKFSSLGESPIFSKLIFTGSLERSITYSKLCAEAHIPCDILLPRRPVVIVYENCSYHTAASGVLEAFFSHDTRSKSGGCKVMIQESIFKKFLGFLNNWLSKILVGHNMSKTDMSCLVTEEQKRTLTECLQEAEKIKGNITTLSNLDDNTLKYTHLIPSLITNLQTNSKLVHEELGGPIIVVIPFRTVKESISMFNCDNKGSPVNIWIHQVSVATEVALKLKTGVVWVNSENVIDAKTPFNGVYFSGNSGEGGKEALFHHMSVVASEKSTSDTKEIYEKWLSTSNKFEKPESRIVAKNDLVKEYKLFIGGTFKCSNNGSVEYSENVFIPSATESDIKNAVSSAVAAQPKWELLTDLQKRKVFFVVIDKLKKVKGEYVTELHKISGNPVDECEKEFNQALDLLYNLANMDDKFCGPVQEIKKTLMALQYRYPLGVIGIQCPDEKPLLSLILLVFSAVVYGNAVVAICSGLYPTVALKMCEIFASASIPSGVINIVCGNNKCLVPALCKNIQVDAIWFTDVPPKIIYANNNVTQRIFCCNKIWTDFNKAKILKCAIECTYTKTIFLPVGDIFAN